MRIFNSIVLSSLVFTGLVFHFQSLNSHSSEKLQKFASQQHLVADNSNDEVAARGSGRKTTDISYRS